MNGVVNQLMVRNSKGVPILVSLMFLIIKLAQKVRRLITSSRSIWWQEKRFWPSWNKDQLYKVQWAEQWILPTPPSAKKRQRRAATNEMSQHTTNSIQGSDMVKIGVGYALTWQQTNGMTGFAAKCFQLKAKQQIMSPSEDER